MTLTQLLRDPEWTQQRIAAAARTSQGTISRLARREGRKASLGLALRIERATGGLVRAEDVPISRGARKDLAALRELVAQAARDGVPAGAAR